MFKCKKDLLFLVFCKKQLYFCSPFYRIFKTTAYMKRFTLIVALVLMVAMPTFAERVTSETAQKVATTFLNNNGAKAAQLTDLSKEAGFKNLYIFNGNPGFVVMAADDCVQPILGYSLTGKFVAENMPTNVSGWLQGYNDEIQYAIDNKVKANSETTKLWKELIDGNSKAAKATVIVDALIQTTWDQDPGYNDLCPYDYSANELTVTGCVATAMAQIMRYWEYPSHGIGSHSYTPSSHPEYGTQSVNFAQQTYDWTDMPLYSPNAEIAKLMYHCGVSVDMDYNIANNGGSGAVTAYVANALKNYFGYQQSTFRNKSNYSNSNWISMLKAELDNGRPLQYSGRGSGGGHSFVCCGYDSDNNFYFNWGWSGSNDGFYSLSNLVPGSGGSGGGSYSFTQEQGAIFGIQPKACTASAPTNFSVTKDGRNAILTWSAANNAVSYYIYRNDLLIASTSNTTYTDIDLAYGTYAYYVKSVDSNGAKSSPTSTITIAIEPVPSQLTVTKQNNNAILNWTEPEWCVPSTDNEVLTYSYGNTIYNFGSGGTMQLYYGHKYPASMINTNKVLYKVSFYPTMTGAFSLHVYTANAGNGKPQTQVYTQDITVSGTSWNDIVLNTPLQLDASKDLWVFIYDPEGKSYPMGAGSYEGTDSNGNYISTSTPTSSVSVQGVVMLINTYITDGAFTYNLYDGTTTVASNISSTTYTVNNITNNTAHRYTLKTNFNGGLTEASNMAGITLGTASLASLTMAANDKMTVTENSTLTVSGSLSDVNADNLILENGAQLINNSTGVQATVKKNISGYTGDGGWYTLSTPFVSLTPSVNNGLISGSYDLYAYDEDGDADGKEWINFKSGSFNLTPSSGYLYANSATQTLDLSGELNSGTYSQTVNLGYNNSIESLKGFNLLGNPTAHEINFTKSSEVSDGYYYVDNGDTWIYSTSSSVPAGRGFLVKANATGQTVTLNPQSKGGNPDKGQYLRLSIGEDNAYVKLSEGVSMPLIDFKGKHSNLYLLCDRKPYVMLVHNDAEALDLCFETKHHGTQTITVDASNLGLNYLHLIDNLTGNDVDLLATPSYTFEANASDYATRFKLVFDANAVDGPSTGSGTFAYISDGNIIITDGPSTPSTGSGTEGSGTCATLQIVDMMGRVVVEGAAMNCVSTSEMTPGVYVLRLINGEKVQTQKIVIE